VKSGYWFPAAILLFFGAAVAGSLLGAPGAQAPAGSERPVALAARSTGPAFPDELGLIRPTRPQAAKEFSVPTPDGGTLRLADLRGQVVFLNFWATWCPPCLEEMPSMERLHRRYGEQGLVVLAVSVDVEGARVVVPFLKEHGLTFPVGLDPRMSLAERYGVRALPSTFLVDREGRLAGMALGPRQWDGTAAYALIESLLR
jgi:peroxiredoxin